MEAAVAERRVADLTVGEFKEIIREVVREAQRQPLYTDAEGNLVFGNEAAYAAYLETCPDRDPSKVRAYYLDDHGLKIRYSDWIPTPEKEKDLEKVRREPAVPLEEVRRELREMGTASSLVCCGESCLTSLYSSPLSG
jgi:hypothetical protein